MTKIEAVALSGTAILVTIAAWSFRSSDNEPSAAASRAVETVQPIIPPPLSGPVSVQRSLQSEPAAADRLQRAMRSEPRAPDWAYRGEQIIKAGLTHVPFLGVGSTVAVNCATSICEVSGRAPMEMSAADLNQYWDLLRSPEVTGGLVTQGLVLQAATYGQPDDPRSYRLYFQRPVPGTTK